MRHRHSWPRAATMALLCLGITSCYKATFHRDASVVKGETQDKWTSFYLFGLVGTEEFDIKDFCPNGEAAEIRTGANFGTSLVGGITLGIYTPHKIYISCASASEKSTRRLELDFDRSGQPVYAQLETPYTSEPLQINGDERTGWRLSTSEVQQ